MNNNQTLIILILLFLFTLFFASNYPTQPCKNSAIERKAQHRNVSREVINIWIIFTRASTRGDLVSNFRKMTDSLCDHSTKHLVLNLITDKSGKVIAKNTLKMLNDCSYSARFYDKNKSVARILDIVNIMSPYFSSAPGTYYFDPLFFLSLGIHRIAPKSHNKIILLDCDLVFEEDIYKLYEHFNRFSESNLFGLAYELSPVYRHALHEYRMKNNGTYIGEPPNPVYHPNDSISSNESSEMSFRGGFPGFNSGIVLMDLDKIRSSSLFESLITKELVASLTEKYSFKGTLGDQDFYTLLYIEYPELFHILECGWNRQLCRWWENADIEGVFFDYYKCLSPVLVLHKNCHTPLKEQNRYISFIS